jgi:hypothetical protein
MTEHSHQHKNEPKSPAQPTNIEEEHLPPLKQDLSPIFKLPTPPPLTPATIMQLQRQHGNRFVNKLVMRSAAKSSKPKSSAYIPVLGKSIQRDFATEAPERAEDAEDTERPGELSERQIRLAIVHNGHRYSRAHTRTIQDIIGTEETGQFSSADIVAIAQIQDEYGLSVDGLIGPEMFRFLNDEMAAEGVDLSDENCLVSFAVFGPDPIQGGRVVNADGTRNVRIRGHFRIRLQFQQRCRPQDFEYRQFIQGTATATRGARSQPLESFWSHIPGGRLPATFQEDGNTTWPAPNYGHRNQPGQATTTTTLAENHYVDEDGTENQASGAIYKAEDFPEATIRGLQAGDVLNIQINFRGEIHRNGRVVQTRNWTAVNMTNFVLS